MRILVTGGGGFLGRNLAGDLAQQGFSVVATFRRSPPETLVATKGLELAQCDLADGGSLPARYDAVVHAAATSAWAGISADAMARDNVEATRRLIAHARGVGAKMFLFCSSMSVYGSIIDREVDESTPIRNPDVYGMSKLIGEAMLAEAAPALAGMALRLPAVIGPGADRNFLAMSARRLKAGEDVAIFNPTAPFNNAVHAADLAMFAGKLLRKGWTGYDTVVLAAAGQTTIQAAVARLRARMASKSRICISDAPKPAFTVRINHATARYGYGPMEILAMLDRYAGEIDGWGESAQGSPGR